MAKKNTNHDYAPDTQKTTIKEYSISFWKLITIVGSAILVSIVGTAFTLFNSGISDHFVLIRAVDDIFELQTDSLKISEFNPRMARVEDDIKEIKQDVKDIRSLLMK